MNNELEKENNITNDAIITSSWIRLSCLEHLLFSKGILDINEYSTMVKHLTEDVMRRILKDIKTPEEIDAIIKDLSAVQSKYIDDLSSTIKT